MSVLSTTLYELFADNLDSNSDKAFLVDPGRHATYGEVAKEVDRISAWLVSRGMMPGDRVVVHARKSIAEVAAMLAVAKLGGVVVNVNHQWTAEQLRYVIEDCGAVLMICEARSVVGLSRQSEPPATLRRSLAISGSAVGDFDRLDDLPNNSSNAVPVLDTQLAMIIYTSGSTGKPKGVMLSHRNIVAGARSVARYLRLTGEDRLLGVLPYSFDYGFNQLTTMLLVGGAVVHQPIPMASEVLRAAREHSVTGIAAVPPLWIQIVRHLQVEPIVLPALRRITNSGGKIPTRILESMPSVFPGVDIFLMYGLTEAFRSTYLHPSRFQQKMGSIGRAIPGAEVYVIRAGEGIASPGEHGELVHRGPLVSLGYWGKPELTAERIRSCPELAHLIGGEPVVYSGDVVRVDEDGDIWFIGRNDALIKTSGFRLSPDEVEDLVFRSGLVSDVVAFGVADDDLGEVVHIAVSPLASCSEDALLRHCRAVMPSYMVPRRIHFWPKEMPRTASGKLARPEVIRACRDRMSESVGGGRES
jgi:acyl-CoA ligase (AMP-forming) (exosortase A-associated)